jgi:hypothetical protein
MQAERKRAAEVQAAMMEAFGSPEVESAMRHATEMSTPHRR